MVTEKLKISSEVEHAQTIHIVNWVVQSSIIPTDWRREDQTDGPSYENIKKSYNTSD